MRAKVRVIDAKGQVVEGYDEYFSSAPAKLREVRGNSEIIVVGKTNCARTGGQAFSCRDDGDDDNLIFGLRELTAEAVVSAAESVGACSAGKCKSYIIDEAATLQIEGISVIAIAPGLHHTLVTLVVNEEGAPVSSTEVEWVNGRILAQAHYEYLLDVAIEPLALPKR